VLEGEVTSKINGRGKELLNLELEKLELGQT
jgi:hypothetical protein